MRIMLLFSLAAWCAALAGCSRPSESLVPVEGRVQVNGKPAKGAIVTFHPVNAPTDAPRPSGQIGDDGTYRLTTREAGDGAAPGDYRVTISWYTVSARRGVYADESQVESQLPAAYSRPNATPLTARITPESAEPVIFEIRKK